MARALLKAKGRQAGGAPGRFALVPLAVLDSSAYAALNWTARALLMELAAQYKGYNNGDLTAAYAVHRGRGWARRSLQRATEELEAAGFIVQTRQGGRHFCNLYALTWKAIDDCPGKNLDHGYQVGRSPLRLWQKMQTPASP